MSEININNQKNETCRPLPNVAPDNPINKTLFYLRLFFDLQVSTQYRDIKRCLIKADKGNILEIGCGFQPYRHLIPNEARYYAIEWKGSKEYFNYKINNAICYDGGILPFKDAVFNLIFHTEVLEHVYDLRQFLSETYRILSINGTMFFTIPFAVRYHYSPNDYWRLTPSSIRKLLENAGFKNIVIANRGNDITVVIYKLNTIFYRVMLGKINNHALRILNFGFFAALFSIPLIFLTIIGHLSILLRIGSPDDCLGYTVYCKKIRAFT